jgi:hypothetical protein
MIVIDEKDEADPSACEMARKRLSHSDYKWELYLSNPTIPNYGIDADFQKSDQRYWFIKCGKCNHWNNPLDYFPDCMNKINGEVWLGCEKCNAKLNKSDGDWVIKYPSNSKVAHGYQYNQLFSNYVDIKDISEDYKNALENGRLQIFYNLTLGKAYVTAKEKLEYNMLFDLCDVEFPKEPFAGDEPVYMGVDQGKGIHCVFKKKKGDKILTWFAYHNEFEELDKYMDKITLCIIDALPETRKAREFALRHRGKIYLNFYNANQKGIAKFNEEQLIVEENRTESLDASHEAFINRLNVLPSRNKEVEEFALHCSNIAKKLEEDEDTGSKRYVWIKLGDDHYRHADNYCYIAMISNKGEANIRWLTN